MDSEYDEVIAENVFYKTLVNEFRDLFLKSISEDCIICVPRAGTVSKYDLALEDFCAHILVPSYELPESHFTNVNGEEVRICNRMITVEHEVGHQSAIHILFEETFYTDEEYKYKVLCLEKPIETKKAGPSGAGGLVVLRTLKDCIDFLWMESGSSSIVEKINQLTTDFLRVNHDLDNFNDLQTIIDLTNSLYVKCVQTALKCPKIRERVELEKCLVSNVKVAVETCMQHNVYNKVIKGISTYTSFEDAHINKVIRNLSSLQIQDLEIRTDLYEAVRNAKFELSKIDAYSTILGKSGCLKKMFNALSNHSSSANVVAADDVLQILIFLVIKIGLANWNAQLKFLKFFRFSATTDLHDEVSFLITSLEAAIEHVQSEMLTYGSNCLVKNNDSDVKGSFQLRMIQYKASDELGSLHKFFREISLGNLERVKGFLNRTENSSDNYIQMCHPLCVCAKCKKKHKENTPTVDSCDGQGLTALHIASMYCKPTIVEYLLTNGADPKKCDFNGLTPMHYAAMRGHQNGLLLIAYAGADVNAQDYSLNTPLHFSSNNGHENCVKALAYFCETSGVRLDVNCQNSVGDTPLHKASRWGYLGIVRILLENGADPTLRNKKKLSSLDLAHNSKILDLLGRPSGEVRNYVPIIPFRPMLDHQEEEVRSGHEPEVKQTVKGVVPTSMDAVKKLEKVFKAIADGDNNLSCFYLGLDKSEMDGGDVVVFDEEEEGSSQRKKCHPLCRCSTCETSSSDDNNQDEASNQRKVHRMNLNSCNADGYTPLHAAAAHGRTDLCRILVRNGALVNVQTRSELATPLMLACRHGRLDAAKTLLRFGCDVDMQDRDGDTALHHACRMRDVKLVEALIEADPDLSLRNLKNRTALQEAKENMFIGVIKAMRGESSLGLNSSEDDTILGVR